MDNRIESEEHLTTVLLSPHIEGDLSPIATHTTKYHHHYHNNSGSDNNNSSSSCSSNDNDNNDIIPNSSSSSSSRRSSIMSQDSMAIENTSHITIDEPVAISGRTRTKSSSSSTDDRGAETMMEVDEQSPTQHHNHNHQGGSANGNDNANLYQLYQQSPSKQHMSASHHHNNQQQQLQQQQTQQPQPVQKLAVHPPPLAVKKKSTDRRHSLMNVQPGMVYLQYKVLGKKGEGTFSQVLKAQNMKTGKYVAIKCMKECFDSTEQVNRLREIQALKRLSPHANIVKLIEVMFDKATGSLSLVFELMDKNIYELIGARKNYLSEDKVKSYMYQLIKSMDHMHKNGIFHRDIKPENVLILNDQLKLADFGSCRGIYSKQPFTEYISTRWYRAPECLLTDGYYNYKMDMWGVGCVFFEIITLNPLFPGDSEPDQIDKIHKVMGTPTPQVLDKFRKNKSAHMSFQFSQTKGTGLVTLLPSHISPECIDLMQQLLSYDPDERITAKQALRHPYFKDIRDAEKSSKSSTSSRPPKASSFDSPGISKPIIAPSPTFSEKATVSSSATFTSLPSISGSYSKQMPQPSHLRQSIQQQQQQLPSTKQHDMTNKSKAAQAAAMAAYQGTTVTSKSYAPQQHPMMSTTHYTNHAGAGFSVSKYTSNNGLGDHGASDSAGLPSVHRGPVVSVNGSGSQFGKQSKMLPSTNNKYNTKQQSTQHQQSGNRKGASPVKLNNSFSQYSSIGA